MIFKQKGLFGRDIDFRDICLSRLSEMLVGGLVWFGMNELTSLQLNHAEWFGVLLAWFIIWCIGTWIRAISGRWYWLGNVVPWLVNGALLYTINSALSHRLSYGQQIYAIVIMNSAALAWRFWLGWRVRCGAEPVAEPLRVLLVAALPLFALAPFFSDQLMGGTDARWYAYMLRDYIDQLRTGVFPVFIGQGEFAWNGGVHLFRSAPFYMSLAGLCDQLTMRSLNALALQHLTVLSTGLLGALGFYAAASALLPARRWLAAIFAALYVTTPAWLGVLYCSDAYMTYMALAVLPALLYGNAKSLLSEDGSGYDWLSLGLGLVWMCHPPMAMIATLATVLLQGGSLIFGRVPVIRWRNGLIGVLVFFGLVAYYFIGMGELPNAPGFGRQDILQIAGFLVALTGLSNALVLARSRWWFLAVLVGAGLASQGSPPWTWWILAMSMILGLLVALQRWRRWVFSGDLACVIMFGALLAGAAIVQGFIGAEYPTRNLSTLTGLSINHSHALDFFRPVRADLSNEGNFQPGPGSWLALLVLAWAFFRRGAVAVKLFFIVGILPFFALVRIPLLSDFLLSYVPNGLVPIISFTMPIRILPMMSAFLLMGGVVYFAALPAGHSNALRHRLLLGLFAATLALGIWQVKFYISRGGAITNSRTRSEDQFRPENFLLERFSYDLLPHPEYLSHGVTDPWLQARILDSHEQVVIGPDETARLMEKTHVEKVRLTAKQDASYPAWIHLAPDIVIKPGERILLRFEFDPKINYAGWLIWTAVHGYREYHLPQSGLALGFGTQTLNSRVISLCNSTDQPAIYHLSMSKESGNSVSGENGFFADVAQSHYDPAEAQIRVDSLQPYRVTTNLPHSGWIETSRVWLPGYAAFLDGQRIEVRASQRGLLMVAVQSGTHQLELRYVGTTKLWIALWVSGLTMLFWVIWRAWIRRARLQSVSL
ncbi:MAG: hypothetical protein WCG63_03960 [Opitutaceae bacterium]